MGGEVNRQSVSVSVCDRLIESLFAMSFYQRF